MNRLFSLALCAALCTSPLFAQEAEDDFVAAWRAAPQESYDAAQIDPAALTQALRAIVVFADSEGDPRFLTQMRLLEGGLAALTERDTIVIVDTALEPRSELRQRLRPRGFSVLLLEKDGKITLRKPEAWSLHEILTQIDKSPTRRNEINAALGRI